MIGAPPNYSVLYQYFRAGIHYTTLLVEGVPFFEKYEIYYMWHRSAILSYAQPAAYACKTLLYNSASMKQCEDSNAHWAMHRDKIKLSYAQLLKD